MNFDERVEYLLRAAQRAEGEGHARVARSLRRMASEFSSATVRLRRD